MTRLHAPAKLTLSLAITGRRPDGYHLLEAEMVSLDLCDVLELEEGGEGLDVVDAVAWVGLPPAVREGSPAPDGPPPEPALAGNLVERALRACGVRARCRLEKHIPAAAGLGGGSSDAAAVLRWCGVTDLAVAAGLGADVPYCLTGGRARVTGIGEVVEQLDPLPESAYLLVTPRLAVSTPAVYAAWDELGGPSGDLGNDLEPAALAAYPGLRWWRDLLGAASGERPRLAGSGGTWFVERPAEQYGALAELAASLRGEVLCGRESAMVAAVRAYGAAGGTTGTGS
ncbi:MAG TPA: 4-(cytidine 5'-diphospho)-2-C-methyl-D-erythritol kinase [Acidimicrobiales bacterium]|nr:4-(cytidine 5'-diphospho)-2-C-methyl-D-erythritol kinase [Acidimicrobiales bacterium]